MQKVTFISIIIGLCILTIVGVGVWLMLARTTSSQQSMAGGAILYVFATIPAVFGIGLAVLLVAGVVFFLLKTTAMYHRSISNDTIEVIKEFNERDNNIIINNNDKRKLEKAKRNVLGTSNKQEIKYLGRGDDLNCEVPALDNEFFNK